MMKYVFGLIAFAPFFAVLSWVFDKASIDNIWARVGLALLLIVLYKISEAANDMLDI